MYLRQRAWSGLCGGQIMTAVQEGRRPEFPASAPAGYVDLCEQCWAQEPHERPSFDHIVAALTTLEESLAASCNNAEASAGSSGEA